MPVGCAARRAIALCYRRLMDCADSLDLVCASISESRCWRAFMLVDMLFTQSRERTIYWIVHT